MLNVLTTQRIFSIDALRGITILVMIFVNEVAGVKGIPAWMKHVPADADGMTFVDVVFPCFLFIVGMAIPFALNNRLNKGDGFVQLQAHILFRTIGLLVLGVFMVNAGSGYNEAAMPFSIHLWSLLFYTAVILTWNVYTFRRERMVYFLRVVGIAILIVLALVYRGGEAGTTGLRPQWWGILGLIGWAYFLGCIIYQLSRGKIFLLLIGIVLCFLLYGLGKTALAQEHLLLTWLVSQKGHAAHTAIVLCGIVLALLFFDKKIDKPASRRFFESFLFAAVLFAAGFLLRPYYMISKIYATPTWCLYSSAIGVVLFCFLYWLIDVKQISAWTAFIKPAAANPLLTYIIPFMVYALMGLTGISWPDLFYKGVYGIAWSAAYAITVMALVKLLNQSKIRLQL